VVNGPPEVDVVADISSETPIMLLKRDAFRSLCRARDLLSDSVEDEHARSIRDVAGEIAISPFHFIRQFEALFGVTPHQFRIARRIDHAKRLLQRGELSVTAVCMEVGFASLGSFSDTFSRRVGTSPSAYRRRGRALVQVPDMLATHFEPGCFGLMALLPASAFRNFREARAGKSA
jgi:AraC-like DNA-binding protein